MKIRIIADEKIPFLKGALEPFATVTYLPGQEITSGMVRDADGLIVRTRTICDETLFSGSSIRFIATATIGFDHIDTNYCNRQGIVWHHAPGCNASGVEQYLACALARLGKIHHWDYSKKTIGIIGVGHVGKRIERLAKVLGMQVLLNDPPREETEGRKDFASLDEILETADIITLHVPLTREGRHRTHHMADHEFFKLLRKSPVFINTSRGAVADTSALKCAIREGMVSHAILDVWEGEPDLDLELLALSAIGTPHIAGYSTEGKARGTALCVRAASRFFRLGIDDWEPASLPPPPDPMIRIIGTGRSRAEVLDEACTWSYDIRHDDRLLRESPSSFERLRNDYPVRREFSAFRILPGQIAPETLSILERLSFTIG